MWNRLPLSECERILLRGAEQLFALSPEQKAAITTQSALLGHLHSGESLGGS